MTENLDANDPYGELDTDDLKDAGRRLAELEEEQEQLRLKKEEVRERLRPKVEEGIDQLLSLVGETREQWARRELGMKPSQKGKNSSQPVNLPLWAFETESGKVEYVFLGGRSRSQSQAYKDAEAAGTLSEAELTEEQQVEWCLLKGYDPADYGLKRA